MIEFLRRSLHVFGVCIVSNEGQGLIDFLRFWAVDDTFWNILRLPYWPRSITLATRTIKQR